MDASCDPRSTSSASCLGDPRRRAAGLRRRKGPGHPEGRPEGSEEGPEGLGGPEDQKEGAAEEPSEVPAVAASAAAAEEAAAGRPLARRPGRRPWTRVRPPRLDSDRMATPASAPDPRLTTGSSSRDPTGDDCAINRMTTLMTDRCVTRTYRSESSCSVDVASSIFEKNHPEFRAMREVRTLALARDGAAKPQRRENGVINICTKCIQLGVLCLIFVSHKSVCRVTASSSSLYFHQLVSSLFTWGDLRYCFYYKNSLFYNLYKVLTKCWNCPIMFFLLDKNGSILE